jgi:hypothetical protein
MRAATCLHELVHRSKSDDGDLSSFAGLSPAVGSLITGPFPSYSELTRFLEMRSMYMPHLLMTLADADFIKDLAAFEKPVMSMLIKDTAEVTRYCATTFAALQNGAFLQFDTVDEISIKADQRGLPAPRLVS